MEIILLEDVHNLGFKDEIIKVKDGYGRNYLIPQKKALLATESARKVLAENLKQRAHKLAKIKADAEAKAAELNGKSVTITVTAKDGKIYGSVTALQIAEQLDKQGLTTDRKTINVPTIKEVGQYKATIRLHKEVSAEINVTVEAAEA